MGVGIAEVMNYPEFSTPNRTCWTKSRSFRQTHRRPCAGLSGFDLNAYIAAGVQSDHECTTVAEAMEKLNRGMFIMIREGSGTKNLLDLLPLITPENERHCFFCTDDRHPNDILSQGHINYMIKTAIHAGLEPITAVRLATLNTAEYFGLQKLGAVGRARPLIWWF